MGRAEAQAAAAQESLARARKELEETRKREVRLRDKLKEFLDTENGGGKLRDLKETTARLEQLERECEVLRAQNLALRKAAVTGDMKAAVGSSSMFSSGIDLTPLFIYVPAHSILPYYVETIPLNILNCVV